MKNNLIMYFIFLCQSVSLIAMDSAIKTHDSHEITSSSALQCALTSTAYLEQARLLQRRLSILSDKALVTVISNQCIITLGELIIIPDIKTGELIITNKKSVAITSRSRGPFCIQVNKPTPSVQKVHAQCGFTAPASVLTKPVNPAVNSAQVRLAGTIQARLSTIHDDVSVAIHGEKLIVTMGELTVEADTNTDIEVLCMIARTKASNSKTNCSNSKVHNSTPPPPPPCDNTVKAAARPAQKGNFLDTIHTVNFWDGTDLDSNSKEIDEAAIVAKSTLFMNLFMQIVNITFSSSPSTWFEFLGRFLYGFSACRPDFDKKLNIIGNYFLIPENYELLDVQDKQSLLKFISHTCSYLTEKITSFQQLRDRIIQDFKVYALLDNLPRLQADVLLGDSYINAEMTAVQDIAALPTEDNSFFIEQLQRADELRRSRYLAKDKKEKEQAFIETMENIRRKITELGGSHTDVPLLAADEKIDPLFDMPTAAAAACSALNSPTPSLLSSTPPPPPPFGKAKKAAAPRAVSTSTSKAILKKSAGPRPLMNDFQTELTKRLAERIDAANKKMSNE